MRRAADWEEFRQALNETEYKCLGDAHRNSESGVGSAGVRRAVVEGCDNAYS